MNDSTIEYSAQLRARLRVLIARAGHTLRGLAERTGHSSSHWYSKLGAPGTGSRPRPLTDSDVDEILTSIGASPEELLRPVFLDGDLEALAWVGATDPGPGLHEAEDWREGARSALERLSEQGLVTLGDELATCTAEGRKVLQQR